MNEAAELARCRDRLAALDRLAAGGRAQWTRVQDAEGAFVEALGPMGELYPVARFHPGAEEAEIDFIVEAPAMLRFLLGLVDRAIRKARGGQARPSAPAGGKADRKNYAAEAALKCQEPRFREFLAHEHGLEPPLTEERAAQKVRSLLGVTSRAELNSNDQAVARWKQLRGDFENWKRAG